MLIHTIVLIHDCTLVYCGAIEHNWKNEDFFKEELNRSWIEPKSFWRKIGQRYGITDNSQNYRKTENFRIFKIRVLEQHWWKAEEKKLHFHHRKTEHKICVLKHTWVSRKLYRLIFLEIQRNRDRYFTVRVFWVFVGRKLFEAGFLKHKTDFSSRLVCGSSSIF